MIRVFNHYIPRAAIFLILLEILLFIISIYTGVSLRFLESPDVPSLQPLWPKALLFAFIMVSAMTAFGLYELEVREEVWQMVLRVSTAFMVGLIGMTLVFYILPTFNIGRGVLAISFLFSLAGVIILRLAFFQFVHLEMLKPRVLVLGTGTRAAKIDPVLKTPEGSRLNIIGYLPLGGTHHYVDQTKILVDADPLPVLVDRYRIDEIILGLRERRNTLPVDELLECKLKGIRIIEISSFFERERGRVQLESLNPSWLILSEGFRFGLYRDAVKRIFDVTASTMLLLLTLPIMAVTALAIVVESGLPIFYRQERVGQGGKIFTILKFRSMAVDAERDGKPLWASQNDVRITRSGKIIRKLRIDELPQIFNVFMGTMSFVGPRPERAFFVSQLITEIPYYSARHTVKPGITGWSQIKYPYGASVDDAIQKLQYDLYYVKNHSVFLDLLILFQTARVVLWGRGAR